MSRSFQTLTTAERVKGAIRKIVPLEGVTMAGALWTKEKQGHNAFRQVLLTTAYPDPIRIKSSGTGIGLRYQPAQSVVKIILPVGF